MKIENKRAKKTSSRQKRAERRESAASRKFIKTPIKQGLSLSLEEAMRRDLVFVNNPVLAQGLALTPVVAAASTLKNAMALIVMALLLITPVRTLGEALAKSAPGRLRVIIYALISGVMYIPALLITNAILGAGAVGAGIYLPALVVDGIVLSRSEIPAREGVGTALRNGFKTTLGLAAALIVSGALREALGEGKLLGRVIFASAPLPIEATVAGGFITAALLAALLQWGAALYKNSRTGGASGE